MLPTVNRGRFIKWFFLFLGVLLTSLLLCLLILKQLAKEQIHSARDVYASYKIAAGLRQSSADLTKMAQMYVITGKKKYWDYFNEILAIRHGTSPRPVHYDQVYWDLVLDPKKRPHPYGDIESLNHLMFSHGFTVEEFALLRFSEELSNELGVIEVKAMHMRDGEYDDGSETYSIRGKPNLHLAMHLVFGDEYMKRKAAIMRPIQEFFSTVEARSKAHYQRLSEWMMIDIIIAISLAVLSTIVMIFSVMKALNSLSDANRESDLLLLNILPASIAERLKKGEGQIADEYQQASVLFADIVGFTTMTARLGVKRVVPLLSMLFEKLDDLTAHHGVEKVKTIGDNYMVVSGVPNPTSEHAIRLAEYALDILVTIEEFNKQNKTDIQMRIGMTFGPVVAGIIGNKKFIYDVWGEVVNIASRMESTSLPGMIQISEKMALMLADNFIVKQREELVDIKGIGLTKNYFLLSKRQDI